MRDDAWTSAHERLTAATRPEVPRPTAAEVGRIWTRVTVAMDAAPRARSEGRRRLALGALAAAVVLGSASVATAELRSTHTGRQPVDAEDVRLGGPGERLDPSASDFPSAVAALAQDVPFPTSQTRDFAVEDQVRDGARNGGNVLVSTGALQAWLADAALCAWSNQWAAAIRDGDAGARAESVAAILGAPDWGAVRAIDPNPYRRMTSQEVQGMDGRTRTEQFVDESQFYWLQDLGEAVKTGDVAGAAAVLAANDGYCRAALVPDIPAADPAYGREAAEE